jgi:hypothetical protein
MVSGRRSENERLIVNIRRFLDEFEALKTEIGEIEDELGLPRLSDDQPWDVRLHRLRERLRDARAENRANPSPAPALF